MFFELRKATPLSAVPPTNKKTHPPISKPHPSKKSFFPTILFSSASAFVFLQQLHQHCIAWCFLIHLPGKKNHLPNDQFLIKILLKNDVFGSSERLPPLSAVPPTNKTTHPPISKPHPATKSFFPPCFSHVQVLCFCATATSTLHCQMFPHPPPRDMFGPC